MKITLIGGAGFIGSHLAAELAAHDHDVLVLDPASPLIRTDGVQYAQRSAPDYLDLARGRHVVVHLAAAVGRVFGEDAPALTIESNASLTASVARWCRAEGQRLVYVSTSEVYGNLGTRVAREDDGSWALPHNLYGLSKRWGEEVATLYAVGYGRRDTDAPARPAGLQIVRPSMPYGPGLPAGRGRAAIVNMLAQATRGERIVTHRASERSWCWIGDLAAGFRFIIERGKVADSPVDIGSGWGCYNLGRDDAPVPMLYVARQACFLAGLGQAEAEALIDVVEAPSNQTTVKRLSTAKLRNLGWAPRVDLEQGMAETLRWMRENGQAS